MSMTFNDDECDVLRECVGTCFFQLRDDIKQNQQLHNLEVVACLEESLANIQKLYDRLAGGPAH